MAGKKGRSGRKRQDFCSKGHDLTNPENVRLVKRSTGVERACLPCARERAREYWRKTHGYYERREEPG